MIIWSIHAPVLSCWDESEKRKANDHTKTGHCALLLFVQVHIFRWSLFTHFRARKSVAFRGVRSKHNDNAYVQLCTDSAQLGHKVIRAALTLFFGGQWLKEGTHARYNLKEFEHIILLLNGNANSFSLSSLRVTIYLKAKLLHSSNNTPRGREWFTCKDSHLRTY